MTGKLKKRIKLHGKICPGGTQVEVIESRGIYCTVLLPGVHTPVTVSVGDVKTAPDSVKHADAVAAGQRTLTSHMTIRRFLQVLGEEHPDNFTMYVVSVLQDAHEQIQIQIGQRLIQEMK